jgi:hypothetical protein
MNVENLVLYARNNEKLDEIMYRMAKRHCTINQWTEIVGHNIIPCYRRELNEPFDGMSKYDIQLAARRLKEIYEDELEEEEEYEQLERFDAHLAR